MAYDTAFVLLRLVPSFLSFTHVVHQILRDLSQSSTFLAEVDDDARAAPLGRLDALLDGMRQVRSTRANVAPENITPVALVVDPHCQFDVFVFDLRRVAPDVGLSGNQISGARRHRRDVVFVTRSNSQDDFHTGRRRHAPDRRQKNLQIVSGNKFRIHGIRLREQSISQNALRNPKPLRHARQVPDRLDGAT